MGIPGESCVRTGGEAKLALRKLILSGATQKVEITIERITRKRAPRKGLARFIRSPLKSGLPRPMKKLHRQESDRRTADYLPIATMLEKLGFQRLVEETLTIHQLDARYMPVYQFVLAMKAGAVCRVCAAEPSAVLGAGADVDGHSWKVLRLPPQSTFWRFLASLHLERGRADTENPARDAGARAGKRPMSNWKVVTIDTDTTGVHPVRQPDGRAQEL